MCIDQGSYRGTFIEMELVGETDGQIQINVKFRDPQLTQRLHYVKEDEIRKIFNFPEKNSGDFILEYKEKEGSLRWAFLFKCLQGTSTRFEYFGYIFRSVDAIIHLIEDRSKNEPKQGELPLDIKGATK